MCWIRSCRCLGDGSGHVCDVCDRLSVIVDTDERVSVDAPARLVWRLYRERDPKEQQPRETRSSHAPCQDDYAADIHMRNEDSDKLVRCSLQYSQSSEAVDTHQRCDSDHRESRHSETVRHRHRHRHQLTGTVQRCVQVQITIQMPHRRGD